MNKLKKINIKKVIKNNILLFISLYFFISIFLINFININYIFPRAESFDINFYINLINIFLITMYSSFILCLFFLLAWIIKNYMKHTFEQKNTKFFIIFLYMFLLFFCFITFFGFIYESVAQITPSYIKYIDQCNDILENHHEYQLNSFCKSFMKFVKGNNSTPIMFTFADQSNGTISRYNYYYFSLCVFFSLNPSNLIPVNNVIKLLVTIEHVMAYFITILYIPLAISLIQQIKEHAKHKRYVGKKYNTILKLEQDGNILVYELIDVTQK